MIALQMFGAMLPCALRVSETFYGNGESYLFSFYDGFKVSSSLLQPITSRRSRFWIKVSKRLSANTR